MMSEKLDQGGSRWGWEAQREMQRRCGTETQNNGQNSKKTIQNLFVMSIETTGIVYTCLSEALQLSTLSLCRELP